MDLTDISVIRSLLGDGQTSFKKKFGQNFLTNRQVVRRIAESAADNRTGILEIGPGIGTLTKELCEVARHVVAVEIDDSLIPILSKTLDGYDNLTVINSDILKVDLKKLIEEHFPDCEKIAVCANLPYYITTPILMFLLESGIAFESITVMVQKEVADRLIAAAGSPLYGAVTASVSYYGQAKKLMNVSAGNFIPAPKVDSAVVQITLYKEPPIVTADTDLFFETIRASFGQRRKTLVNALSSAFPKLAKSDIADAVVSCGLDPNVRGERLDIADFAKVADSIYRLKPDAK